MGRSQKTFISITAELHETWLCEVRHQKCTKIQTGVSDHVFIELQKLFHKLWWTFWRRLSVSTSLVNTPQVEFTSSKVWTNIWNCSANVPQCCQDLNLKINKYVWWASFLSWTESNRLKSLWLWGAWKSCWRRRFWPTPLLLASTERTRAWSSVWLLVAIYFKWLQVCGCVSVMRKIHPASQSKA